MIDQVAIEKDIAFTSTAEKELLCDLYRPSPSAAKNVGVIHIHGGGGTGGSKDGARLAASLAERGYLGIAMQYRLAPEAMWPAQLEDVNACISWARGNAPDLGIDSSKIALLGYSIGAQFAFVAAGAPADGKISACVCLYTSGRNDNGSASVLGEARVAQELDRLDPLAYIHPRFPPTQLFHGNADTVVDAGSSFELYKSLTAAGVPAELHVVEGVNHGFEGWPEFATPTAAFIDLFLERHVVMPRSYRERPPRR